MSNSSDCQQFTKTKDKELHRQLKVQARKLTQKKQPYKDRNKKN